MEKETMQTTDEIQRFGQEYTFRLAPVTRDLYKRFVFELFEYTGKQYDEMTPRDIRNWLQGMATEGFTTSTQNTKLAGVKLFYRYLKEEGLVEKNPTERIPLSKLEEKLPHYLLTDQLMELRQLVKNVNERAVVETLYCTGVRISELVAMQKVDINWEERSIHIPKGKRKKARIVLFTRECGEYLKAYLASRQDNLADVFLNPYGRKRASKVTIQVKFKSYVEHLGFNLTPHTLRHTFAAHLAAKGMPIQCLQILLGHEDQNQTQYYAKLYDHARKAIYDEWM
jgi:site-specific recombinase XerD